MPGSSFWGRISLYKGKYYLVETFSVTYRIQGQVAYIADEIALHRIRPANDSDLVSLYASSFSLSLYLSLFPLIIAVTCTLRR